jgi:hypothetical protein
VDLHHLLLAGLPAHLCENSFESSARRIDADCERWLSIAATDTAMVMMLS